uniref:Ig-like domain-containing protein n=1 Tax=Pyxicephalus adspersus TaxID=30357 RepID=A0AAV3BCE4_PYXAD|nr:TPA: hypothetical protein GDO54_002189 [Pyxicephalus adspersus]
MNNISNGSTNQTYATCPAPLSAPWVNVSCHIDGSASVSCVLEKDRGVTYTWRVNGEFLHGNHSPNITFINEEFISGPLNVKCSVNNSVSMEESNNTQIFCPAPLSAPSVNFSCLNDGRASVSCVLEKDRDVTYTWTLNGKLWHREHSPNITLTIEELRTGPINVSCAVNTSVSRKESNNIQIYCPGEKSVVSAPCHSPTITSVSLSFLIFCYFPYTHICPLSSLTFTFCSFHPLLNKSDTPVAKPIGIYIVGNQQEGIEEQLDLQRISILCKGAGVRLSPGR